MLIIMMQTDAVLRVCSSQKQSKIAQIALKQITVVTQQKNAGTDVDASVAEFSTLQIFRIARVPSGTLS